MPLHDSEPLLCSGGGGIENAEIDSTADQE